MDEKLGEPVGLWFGLIVADFFVQVDISLFKTIGEGPVVHGVVLLRVGFEYLPLELTSIKLVQSVGIIIQIVVINSVYRLFLFCEHQ